MRKNNVLLGRGVVSYLGLWYGVRLGVVVTRNTREILPLSLGDCSDAAHRGTSMEQRNR